MDPVNTKIIYSILMMIPTIIMFASPSFADQLSETLGIFSFGFYILFLVGISNLIRIFTGTKWEGKFLTFYKCPYCGQELKGREYQQQIRDGIAKCPSCGAIISFPK